MRLLVFLTFSVLLAFHGLSQSQTNSYDADSCNAYLNWEELAKMASSHVIAFGELHGTNESPEAVRGFLCELISDDQPIRFGVEARYTQGERLNAALSYPLNKEAVYNAASFMWDSFDGRSSEAIYQLLESIALWKSQGAQISVFAFDFDSSSQSDIDLGRSKSMAREVDKNVEGFSGAVVLLTGDFHIALDPVDGPKTGGTMASEVTSRPVVSLQMKHKGGEAFVTMWSSLTDETTTGAQKWGASSTPSSPERFFDLTPRKYHSGIYYTGTISASPPAFPKE